MSGAPYYQPYESTPISQGYGATPYALAGGEPNHFHDGIDFAAPLGTKVYSYLGGTVTGKGYDPSGYGNYLEIQQPTGVKVLWGHLQDYIGNLSVGSVVPANTPVALTGSSGNSTGPHVHVRVDSPSGTSIDPRTWLASLGVNTGSPNSVVDYLTTPPPVPSGAPKGAITSGPLFPLANQAGDAVGKAASSAVSGLLPGWLQSPNWLLVGVIAIGLFFILAGLLGVALKPTEEIARVAA